MPPYTPKNEEEKKIKEAIDSFVGFMSTVKEVEKAQQALVKHVQTEIKSQHLAALKKKKQ